ncbi:MAG: glycosyltransferase family 9 protein [Desulfobacula sp.]|nr:glycosyltransferase family 9 protein [Desulfobacula sp.]
MNLTRIIKFVDRVIGPLLLLITPSSPVHKNLLGHKNLLELTRKILVIRPGGMGDALLLLPVLKKTSVSRGVTIDILCEPRNKTIFENAEFINKVFSYQNPLSALSLFQHRYDAVIDTEQSYILSAWTARLVPAKLRVGFDTFKRKKMFNRSIAYHANYEADNFWQLFSIVFKFKKPFSFNYPYIKASKTKQSLYNNLENIICLFPGATTHQRHWPEKRWAQVCDHIAARGYTPVLIGGSMEIQSCNKIFADCTAKNIVNLSGELSIAQTVHLFTHAKGLISTDSGILHLGVICNIPTISLFGPSSPKKWGPTGRFDQIIHKGIDCAPCASFGTIPACRNKNACMQKIVVEDVLNAFEN